MNSPPSDKECEVILQWMHTYYDDEKLLQGEREFIRDNYWREEFDDVRWLVDALVLGHLDPMPESLEKLLEAAK